METVPETETNIIPLVFSLIPAALGFIITTVIGHGKKFRAGFVARHGTDKGVFILALYQKFSGAFFYGAVPLAGLAWMNKNIPDHLAGPSELMSPILAVILSLAAVLVLAPASYFTARRSSHVAEHYPEFSVPYDHFGKILLMLLAWGAYLSAYEILFRGILLYSFHDLWGYWPSVVLNILLYSAFHLPKGMKEALACIPLGFYFCMLSFSSGGVWLPAAAHVLLSWTAMLTTLARKKV